MINLINTLSSITTIPPNVIEKLVQLSTDIICNEIITNKVYENESFSQVDIGIGTINISIDNDSIRYKYIPSTEFDTSIQNCISSNKNPLIDKLENKITDKLLSAYKELL